MKRKAFVFLILLFFIGFACVLPHAVPKFGATPEPIYTVLFVVCFVGVIGSCVGLVRCGPGLRCPNCKEPIIPRAIRTPMGGRPITSKELVCCPHCRAIVHPYDFQVEE